MRKNLRNTVYRGGLYTTGLHTNARDRNYYPLLNKALREMLSIEPPRPMGSVLGARNHSVSTDSSISPTIKNNGINISRQTIYFDYSPVFANLKLILNDKSKTVYERQILIEKFMLTT